MKTILFGSKESSIVTKAGNLISSLVQLRVSITTDDTARRSIVDPAVQKECLDKSLKTMMEICVRCLSNEQTDRPSIEDILWNLQYAAQVQDTGRVDSPDNQESPISSTREMQPPTSLITSNERAEF